MKELFRPKTQFSTFVFLFLGLFLLLSFSLYAAGPEKAPAPSKPAAPEKAPVPKKAPKQDPCAVCCGTGLCDPAVFEMLGITPDQSKEINMIRGQASQEPDSLEKLNAKISELQLELLTLMSKSPDQLTLMTEKINQISKAQGALTQKATYTALQMLKVLKPEQVAKYWETMGVKPATATPAAAPAEKGKEEKAPAPAPDKGKPAAPEKGKSTEGKKETK